MQRLFLKIFQVILILSLVGVSYSCSRNRDIEIDPIDPPDPNTEACEVRLSFDYILKEDGEKEGFDPKDVESLHVFVFNEDNTYMETWVDKSPKIENPNYFFRLLLEPGVYHFIVYGNLRDNYQMSPLVFTAKKTRMEDILLSYNNGVSNEIYTHPHHLFYSSLINVSISQTKGIDSFTIPLVRNTYRIRLTTEGLPMIKDKYRFTITDANASYKLDNSFAPSMELLYIQDCVEHDINTHMAEFVCLRLDKKRQPALKLYDKITGELLYENNLIELLLTLEDKGFTVDFNRMYDFEICLRFERQNGSLSVEIIINGWKVIEKDVIIDL